MKNSNGAHFHPMNRHGCLIRERMNDKKTELLANRKKPNSYLASYRRSRSILVTRKASIPSSVQLMAGTPRKASLHHLSQKVTLLLFLSLTLKELRLLWPWANRSPFKVFLLPPPPIYLKSTNQWPLLMGRYCRRKEQYNTVLRRTMWSFLLQTPQVVLHGAAPGTTTKS